MAHGRPPQACWTTSVPPLSPTSGPTGRDGTSPVPGSSTRARHATARSSDRRAGRRCPSPARCRTWARRPGPRGVARVPVPWGPSDPRRQSRDPPASTRSTRCSTSRHRRAYRRRARRLRSRLPGWRSRPPDPRSAAWTAARRPRRPARRPNGPDANDSGGESSRRRDPAAASPDGQSPADQRPAAVEHGTRRNQACPSGPSPGDPPGHRPTLALDPYEPAAASAHGGVHGGSAAPTAPGQAEAVATMNAPTARAGGASGPTHPVHPMDLLRRNGPAGRRGGRRRVGPVSAGATQPPLIPANSRGGTLAPSAPLRAPRSSGRSRSRCESGTVPLR